MSGEIDKGGIVYEEATQERDYSQLEQREKALSAATQRLEKVTIILEEKLQPVLFGAKPRSDDEKVATVNEVLPPHHERLRDATRTIDSLCRRLEELSDRTAL